MKIFNFALRRVAALCLLPAFVCLLAAGAWAVPEGLYFKDPVVGSFSWRALEKGAKVTVDICYNNPNAYESLSAATLNFYYDNNIIDNIDVPKLCPTMVRSDPVKVENGSNSKIMVGLTSSGAPGQGPLALAASDNNPLVRISFRVKQSTTAAALNIRWVKGSETGVVIGGSKNPGQKDDASDTIKDVTIKAAYLPKFDGLGAATDPQNGNTLNLSWPSAGKLSNDNHDNDSGANNNLAPGAAATYYSNGLLKNNIYRDGAAVHQSGSAGETTWTNSGLNDMQEYTFRATAIDDCSPQVNESANVNTFKGTPHDYESPGASMADPAPKNEELTPSWNSGAGDLGGYIVVKKVGAISDPDPSVPSFAGAKDYKGGNTDGTPPSEVKAALIAAGWELFYEGLATSKVDKGLDNSKKYWYLVYAYDKTKNELGTSPIQQGYNWSSAMKPGYPGEAPDAISEFRPLSDVTNGITFKWKTSVPPNYAGTKIVYTTNYDDWAILDTTSPEAVDYKFTGDKTALTETVTWEGLDPTKVYYFKAFAHNSSSRLWSGAYAAAAVPGGGKGGSGSFTYDLRAARGDKLVTNTIAVPTSWSGLPVEKLVELINAKSASGKAIVTAIGGWDPDSGESFGWTADGKGKTFNLKAGVGYQVYVSEEVKGLVVQ
jgi:hypothetical protein